MAISGKKARRIVVDDERYVWAVSEDSGYSVLIVQSATGSGQRLEVQVSWEDTGTGSQTPVSLTPHIVAEAIRDATQQGWVPNKANPKPLRRRLLSGGKFAD